MEKKIFKKYFTYILLAYIFISFASAAVTYYYYDKKITDEFSEFAKSKEKNYMSLLKSLIAGEEKSKEELNLMAIINDMSYFEVIDEAKNVLFLYKKEGVSLPLFLKDKIILLKDDFHLLTKNDQGYSFWFLSTINLDKKIVLIGSFELNKYDSNDIDRTFEAVLLSIFATSLIIALIIFPIILLAHKELSARRQHLLKSYVDTIEALGNAIAKRDSDTNSHNFRVTWYSIKIAEAMELQKEKMAGLIMGAFLHDIGKIGIRDNILLKPGKLDSGEFEIMKTHVTQGGEILRGIEWLVDAKKVVLEHHERMDGKGYPNGLKGEVISIEARIFMISDVFDALTSKRPYKEPIPLHKAIEIMQEESGTHFDSDIFEKFKNISSKLYEKASDANLKTLKRMLALEVGKYFEIEKQNLGV